MNQLSRVILFSACYILCISAFAQCPDVDAGPDQTSCTIPGVFTLSGSSSSTPIETTWSPITGLSDPNSLTTIATVAVETEYVLTVKSINYDINYVVNGDFMDGNVNFTTDYDFHDNPTFPGNELIEGEYSIGTNPAPMHINWVACGDHTSGDGNMMLVNGDQTANQNAWCQSISVTPNTEYAFSAWVTSVDPNGPCEIQFNINGIPIGDGNVALTTTCVWTQFFVLWESGAATDATICITDLNTQAPGNDFAIDDIIFSPVCTDMDTVVVTPFMLSAEAVNNGPICEGETFTLEAMVGETYSWSGPLNFSSNQSTISVNEADDQMSGTYLVTVTDSNGCTATAATELEVIEEMTTQQFAYTCVPEEEGTFTEVIETDLGCDSTVITYVFLEESNTVSITNFTCDSLSSGMSEESHLNQFGCDSIVIINNIFAPNYDIEIFTFTCDQTEAGSVVEALSTIYGCDSVVTHITEFVENFEIDLVYITCDTALAGTVIDTFQSLFGCDSIVSTITLFEEARETDLLLFTCDSTFAGESVELLSTLNGCDSTVFTTVLFVEASADSFFLYTCDNNETGIFLDTFANEYGCDSIQITTIMYQESSEEYLYQTTCDSTAAGIFMEENIDQFGCDSIIVTSIDYIESTIQYFFDNTCDELEAGVFVQDLENIYGCDSTVITEVYYQESHEIYLFATTCDINEADTFSTIYNNVFNCDSLVVTEVTYLKPDSTFLHYSTCIEAESGYFVDFLINQNDCDSIVFRDVTLNDSPVIQFESFTCDENEVGQFTDTLLTIFGCDSTIINSVILSPDIITNLTISPLDCFQSDEGVIEIDIIEGMGPFTYALNNDSEQSESIYTDLTSGTYELAIMDVNGCISMEIIVINNVLPVDVELGNDVTISYGDSAEINAVVDIPYDSLITILWSPNDFINSPECLTQITYPLFTTTFSLYVENSFGCSDSDEITIAVDRTRYIYVPNIFSPNDDGINDVFMIYAKDNQLKQINLFRGYDRWGSKLWEFDDFQPNDPNYSWDGTFLGESVNASVFAWYAELEYLSGEVEVIYGDVTIIK